MKADMPPVTRLCISIVVSQISGILIIRAPKRAGMARMNENSNAFFRFIPSKSAVATVIPEREIPGVRASA